MEGLREKGTVQEDNCMDGVHGFNDNIVSIPADKSSARREHGNE